jgi:hypothetical protein
MNGAVLFQASAPQMVKPVSERTSWLRIPGRGLGHFPFQLQTGRLHEVRVLSHYRFQLEGKIS